MRATPPTSNSTRDILKRDSACHVDDCLSYRPLFAQNCQRAGTPRRRTRSEGATGPMAPEAPGALQHHQPDAGLDCSE